jgi:RNA polymerase sigma-70 factor, ECF subfamily
MIGETASILGLRQLHMLAGSATLAPMDMGVIEDSALMLRYRDGDVRAFEILYSRHKGALYRYLQRLCRDREVANDLFQEVWAKVIASRERYEVRAQFNTFLFRIAHNCAIDYFRRSGKVPVGQLADVSELEEMLPGSEADRPDDQASAAQVKAAFKRALDQLPAEQRDVFVLYEESGLSLEEIGKVTGVAMETAKSRLRYAVSKLRAALKHHEPAGVASCVICRTTRRSMSICSAIRPCRSTIATLIRATYRPRSMPRCLRVRARRSSPRSRRAGLSGLAGARRSPWRHR